MMEEIAVTKQAYDITISRELLMDTPEGFERLATPKEKAARKRWIKQYEAKQAILRAEGRLDDAGYEKGPNDCPVRIPLGNYDSTDDARCELVIGHAGPHRCSVEWEPYDS
jgi:hypothetical protein